MEADYRSVQSDQNKRSLIILGNPSVAVLPLIADVLNPFSVSYCSAVVFFLCYLACIHIINCFTTSEGWTSSPGSTYFHILQQNATTLHRSSSLALTADVMKLTQYLGNKAPWFVRLITTHTCSYVLNHTGHSHLILTHV